MNTFEFTGHWATLRGIKLWAQASTTSTNTIAKDDTSIDTKPLPPQGGALVSMPSLYLTGLQSEGRGRGQNPWISTEGALLSTWAYRTKSAPQPILSPLVGLALFDALSEAFPKIADHLSLKAPNDLYLHGKKLAGILIETVSNGLEYQVIVGLGLNASSAPDSLSQQATSLPAVTESDWFSFLDQWSARLTLAMIEGLASHLSFDSRTRLKDAMNLNPHLEEPILEIDGLGQIKTPTRTYLWSDL